MKVKIINSELDDYNAVLKVRRMNFDQIIVNYPIGSGIKTFSSKDVEYMSENKVDEFLIENREFLKIKLKRGIGVAFYSALKESIEQEINEAVSNLNIVKDKYSINKRGIWQKELAIFVNRKYPLEIISSGENFKKNSYNIIINEFDKDIFLNLCNEEMSCLKKEVEQKNSTISRLEQINSDFGIA